MKIIIYTKKFEILAKEVITEIDKFKATKDKIIISDTYDDTTADINIGINLNIIGFLDFHFQVDDYTDDNTLNKGNLNYHSINFNNNCNQEFDIYKLKEQNNDHLNKNSKDSCDHSNKDSKDSCDDSNKESLDHLNKDICDHLNKESLDHLNKDSCDHLNKESLDHLNKDSCDHLNKDSCDHLNKDSDDDFKINLRNDNNDDDLNDKDLNNGTLKINFNKYDESKVIPSFDKTNRKSSLKFDDIHIQTDHNNITENKVYEEQTFINKSISTNSPENINPDYDKLLDTLIVNKTKRDVKYKINNILNHNVNLKIPEKIKCSFKDLKILLTKIIIKILGYSEIELCNIQYRGPDGVKKKENFTSYVRNNFYFFEDKYLFLDKNKSFKAEKGLKQVLDLFKYPYTQINIESVPLTNLLEGYFLYFKEDISIEQKFIDEKKFEVNEKRFEVNKKKFEVNENLIDDTKVRDVNINDDSRTKNISYKDENYSKLYKFKNIFKMNSSSSEYIICKFFNIHLVFMICDNYNLSEVFDIGKNRQLIDKINHEILIPFLYNDFEMSINSYFNKWIDNLKDMNVIENILKLLPEFNDHRKNYLKKLEKKYRRILQGDYMIVHDTAVDKF
ncbi:hypothetical protein DMUE_1975 [Dictyocoela muelleri]|nr:hypothetical protein DMUE_1975 [Dictyocoela muelleri]